MDNVASSYRRFLDGDDEGIVAVSYTHLLTRDPRQNVCRYKISSF